MFSRFLKALENNQPYEQINNLIYKSGDEIIRTRKDELYDQDELPPFPYEKLNRFYPFSDISVKPILVQKLSLIIQASVAHSNVLFVQWFLFTTQDGKENLHH